jgi:MoxR-like ATPase
MKNITELKLAIMLCRDAGITSFVWGHRGLGKSQAHSQIAKSNRWGFIDLRCSQMEASDLRGLPDKQTNRTVYLPPADLPQGHGHEKGDSCPACDKDIDPAGFPLKDYCRCPACDDKMEWGQRVGWDEDTFPQENRCKGLLFLDELNRAEDDVLQSGFQLVLDKKVGQYTLPPGWSVHVAGNYATGYMVNAFDDPAFINRFCHLSITPTDEYFDDWIDYMIKYKSADKIMQFVGFNRDHLYGAVKGGDMPPISPSPRSWEMVARVEQAAAEHNYPDNIKLEVEAGLIGRDLSLQFQRFSCDVTPEHVMKDGLEKIKSRLGKLNRNQLVGLVWGVAANAKQHKIQEVAEKVLDFMGWVASETDGITGGGRDLAVSLGRSLCSTETQALGGAVLSNPHLAKLAAKYRKGPKDEVSWIALITKRPKLQELMSKVSFGLPDDSKKGS